MFLFPAVSQPSSASGDQPVLLVSLQSVIHLPGNADKRRQDAFSLCCPPPTHRLLFSLKQAQAVTCTGEIQQTGHPLLTCIWEVGEGNDTHRSLGRVGRVLGPLREQPVCLGGAAADFASWATATPAACPVLPAPPHALLTTSLPAPGTHQLRHQAMSSLQQTNPVRCYTNPPTKAPHMLPVRYPSPPS